MDQELIKTGELTPVFFGSAMTNFGVRPFLDTFLKMAQVPAPTRRGGLRGNAVLTLDEPGLPPERLPPGGGGAGGDRSHPEPGRLRCA